MTQNLQATTRRCSAGERCASHAALGAPAKLSRGNPGPLCYACEERRAAAALGKGAARPEPAEGRGEAPRRRPRAGGDGRRQGGDGGQPPASCAKGSCQRPAARLVGGARLCREHAEAGLARGWQEGRALWVLACERNLREALASGDERLARKWSGLLGEAQAALAWAEADLAAREARAHR